MQPSVSSSLTVTSPTLPDVAQSSAARIYLGKQEVIVVGMLFDFDHAADHDITQILAKSDKIVDRRAARGEQVAQLGRAHVERNERAQPLVGRVHLEIW